MNSKQRLRKQLREARRHYVGALPEITRALLFKRPPAPLMELVPDGATIGLYHARSPEAPTASYANFFFEAGYPLALPRFENRASAMEFHRFNAPFDESDLEPGPFDLRQPPRGADAVIPEVLLMPLLGFTALGERLGQGGGHYDRWLADHPQTITIGMAWDPQLVESLPLEPHDMPLTAVITPTRFYGPFDA